jgi:hypothetical protein
MHCEEARSALRAAASNSANHKGLATRHEGRILIAAMRTVEHDSVPPLIESVAEDDPRRTRILAKTIYRELRSNGLDERAVLALATELLGLVAEDMRSAS